MARITPRTSPHLAVLCGVCDDALAMDHYSLCDGCASIEERALGRAEYHSERADDLREAGRLAASLAADQADLWAGALASEWSV